MNKQHKLLAAGELLWDELPTGRRCGGAPGNIVYHAAMQGLDARLCSAVGQDPDGDELLDFARSCGLKTDFIPQIALASGRVSVTLNNGIPVYVIHSPAAWDAIPLTKAVGDFAASADAFCFGSLAQRNAESQKTILSLASLTPEKALRIFDANLRQEFYSKSILEDSLNVANVLKLSDEELPVMRKIFKLPEDSKEALQKILEKFKLHFILFSCGKNGSYYLDSSAYIFQETISGGAVTDTVGCGDSFLASFISAYLSGASPEYAMYHASAVAGLVAASSGAMPDDDVFVRRVQESLSAI